MRVPARLATTLLLLLVGTSLAAPASAQSPDATPDARRQVIGDALEKLAELDSYRVESRSTTSTAPGREFGLESTVVLRPTFALSQALLADGEPGLVSVAIGDESWQSYGGSPFVSDAQVGTGSFTPDDAATSMYSYLEHWAAERLIMDLVGPDTVGGIAALHYHGETRVPTASTDPEDPYYRRALRGSLDLWVDAERGHVLKALTDVVDSRFTYGNGGDAVGRHEEIAILDVDDPANVVEPPDLTAPLLSPGPDDPQMVALLEGAIDALADLDSYRVVSRYDTLGFGGGQESTVLNGDPATAETVVLTDGSVFIRFLVSGDEMWSQDDPTSPWEAISPGDGPSCDGEPCGFQMAAGTSLMGELVAIAGGFTLVGEETLDGMAVTHVRAERPMVVEPYGATPTVNDVWIAKDGGYLVRWVNDGVGSSTELRIEGVNDPANVVVVPPSPLASPAP